MKGLLERNLASARAVANSRQKFQLGVGEAGTRALSGIADVADRGLSGAAGLILGRGAEGGLPHQEAKGVGEVYQALRSHPRAAKYVAFGLPAALLLNEQSKDQLTPLMNEAVQEGRKVYANDKSFIEKKASLEQRILDNASGVKVASVFGAIGGGILNNMGSIPGFGQGQPGLLGMAGNAISSVAGGNNNQTSGFGDTAKYQLNRRINPLTDRVRADETFASNFFSSLGSETAKSMVGLLKDMAGKAVTRVQNAPAHMSMVQNLQAGDPMLSRADPEVLSNAYHTMSSFAPTLATDENAVRSFLREAVMAGAGPDYASIANLAKAESTIVGRKTASAIEINLEKLINPEAAARLRGAGLNKVAAAMLKQDGFKVGSDLTMRDAVTVLGTKLRQKNAEWARVREGLNALGSLSK